MNRINIDLFDSFAFYTFFYMATVSQALRNPWISVPLAILSAYLYPFGMSYLLFFLMTYC